ncbi:MAG TPA: hypothetical protein VIM58_04045 [Candidatus Methylacidiphilales bacterium]
MSAAPPNLLERLLFADADGRRRPEPALWAGAAIAVAVFFATRFLVLGLYALRHYDLLSADPTNYIAVANYLTLHHHLPTGYNIDYRQFPGLSMVMALLNPVLGGNMERTGYLVAYAFSVASVVLFHYLFRNFRLTLLYTVFVPNWVATSTILMSEGLTYFLLLLAIWAFHRTTDLRRRVVLLVVAGFALVVRNTAVFLLVPFIAVWWWEQERGKRGRLALYALAVGLLPALYLAWNVATIGDPFPQRQGQAAYFAYMADGGYPSSLMTAPGVSLLHGFGLKTVPLAKKLAVGASFILVVIVIWRFFRTKPAPADKALYRPFGCAALLHFLFHLCIGGSFGFTSFDRYISHLNPILPKGVVGDRQLRYVWIVLVGLVGVLFAGLTGRGNVAILKFLKPE